MADTWGGSDYAADDEMGDIGITGGGAGGAGFSDNDIDFGSFRGSSEEEDAALQQDIAAAAAMSSGVQGLGDYQFERGDLSGLLDPATYRGLLSGQGLNLGGFSPLANRQAILEAQRAVMGVDPYQTAMAQIPGRMQKAKAGYGIPGVFGAGLGSIGQFTLGQIQKGLKEGGRPVFDAKGNIAGVFTKGLFGLGEVYTGTPVEGMPETGWSAPDYSGEEIAPVEEETGKCPEGYIFDEDLQACRLDTGSTVATEATSEFEPGGYARLGLLDQPPQGLLEVGGQPYDFEAANRAYRLATATRPEYYSDPYNLQGYTLLA